MKAIARRLRKQQTPPEQLLWKCLRNHSLLGLGFRRQQPIGCYIVDFCCFEMKLIIEVDGSHHDFQWAADEKRQKYLESKGYRVLRYNAIDVMQQLHTVVTDIQNHLSLSPGEKRAK
jgi:very-short-patch-repair endonuclease